MVNLNSALIVLAAALSVQAASKPKCCAADKCFKSASLPAKYSPTASSFCQKFIGKTRGTVTRTSTKTVTATQTKNPGKVTATATAPGVTQTVTVTPAAPTFAVTLTEAIPITITAGTSCTKTITTSLTTQVNYPTGSTEIDRRDLDSRGYPSKPQIPEPLSRGCSKDGLDAKISSACSCYLTSKTVTSTKTVTNTKTVPGQAATQIVTVTGPAKTNTVTAPAPDPITDTSVVTKTNIQVEQPCTETFTEYMYTGGLSCGIPSPTAVGQGSVTCDNDASPPQQTNARFRIEASDSEGTLFEDCLLTGPEDITTPSGGTHLCDGTNNNANPAPGGTLTTSINDAGQINGFDFDGTYSNQFQDFFINRIGETTSNGNAFWGVLRNMVFTARGGCQEQVSPADEGLWLFDAFRPNLRNLRISPEYQILEQGTTGSVTIIVLAANPNNGNTTPFQGASIQGQSGTSGSDGSFQITVPSEPGCYQYKATASGQGRSNAFYLTVLPPSEDGEPI